MLDIVSGSYKVEGAAAFGVNGVYTYEDDWNDACKFVREEDDYDVLTIPEGKGAEPTRFTLFR